MIKNNFLGKWYICEMEMWDKDYIDAETKAYILFDKDSLGEFQFGYAHGRGYAEIVDSDIIGNIFIHNGDSSEFKAIK